MRQDDYVARDATALAASVASGECSPAELLQSAREQMARVQPRINAMLRPLDALAQDQIDALAAGRAGTPRGVPAQAASRATHGALAGVPFLVKDSVFDVAGIPTSYGSRSLLNVIPDEHAAGTRRLLDAGLVIFGKTNLPEFGLKGVSDSQAFGRVSNPWHVDHVAGGSSGGSAAAVAAGVVPMASGNDGGGSLRIPAACCGLFALKPSRGRVSCGPGFGEVWFGACSDGVISRSVRDSAIGLDILEGPEPGEPFLVARPEAPYAELLKRPPGQRRIGWSTQSPIGTPVHPEAIAAVEQTARLLESLGHHVEEAEPKIDGDALARSFLHLYFGQIPATVAFAMQQGAKRHDFELLTLVMAVIGKHVSAPMMTGELIRWNQFARALGAFHQRFDFWLTPTLATPPMLHGAIDPPPGQLRLLRGLLNTGLLGLLARNGALRGMIDQLARDNLTPYPFTQLANLTGTPAMSVPLHWTAEGLPLGVQFVGRQGEEGTMLQLAAQLEEAQPWFDRLAPMARG